MKFPLKTLSIFIFFCSIFGIYNNAYAFPGRDMMKIFSEKERQIYVAALVHMASFQAYQAGEKERGQCMLDWLHKPDQTKAMKLSEHFFTEYPDKDAAPIVLLLMNRKCGESPDKK